MASTPSNMLELETVAHPFLLRDTDGSKVGLNDIRGAEGTLVLFICNHCPYVIHIEKELVVVTRWALENGIGVAGINSNDIETYPDDSPEKMKKTKERLGYAFPYLFDATQEVAKAYHAACTPDFFLFDKDLKLAYRGQFDDSRPKNSVPVTGRDLKAAMNFLIEGKPVPKDQRASLGCNIKWRPGNEPKY